MTTHAEYSRDSYPANKHILQKVGGIKAHLLCRIYWATNLKDGVCRMGLTRLGGEIGFGRSTVGRAAKELVEDGYINKVKEADQAAGQPPHYQVTKKFYDLLSVPERDDPSQSGTAYPTEGQPPVPERDKDIDPSLNIDTDKKRGAKNAPAPRLSKLEREPKPAAVHTYNRIARLWPDKALWQIIDDTIGDKPESLARFEAVVTAYIGAGWNKRNINGMLDFYRRGEMPGTATERGSNGLRKGNRGTQDDEWAECTAKSQEALAARIAAVTVS